MDSIELTRLCKDRKRMRTSQTAILVLNWVKHSFCLWISLKEFKKMDELLFTLKWFSYNFRGNSSWLIHLNLLKGTEAVVQTCYAKKVLLEISQNSQENTCARVSFLIKKLYENFIKLYLKRGSGSSAFLWILRNF